LDSLTYRDYAYSAPVDWAIVVMTMFYGVHVVSIIHVCTLFMDCTFAAILHAPNSLELQVGAAGASGAERGILNFAGQGRGWAIVGVLVLASSRTSWFLIEADIWASHHHHTTTS